MPTISATIHLHTPMVSNSPKGESRIGTLEITDFKGQSYTPLGGGGFRVIPFMSILVARKL